MSWVQCIVTQHGSSIAAMLGDEPQSWLIISRSILSPVRQSAHTTKEYDMRHFPFVLDPGKGKHTPAVWPDTRLPLIVSQHISQHIGHFAQSHAQQTHPVRSTCWVAVPLLVCPPAAPQHRLAGGSKSGPSSPSSLFCLYHTKHNTNACWCQQQPPSARIPFKGLCHMHNKEKHS